jgi:phytoene synthase
MRTESHATLSPLSVEASYQHAEALTRQYARTFYFASALLPPAQRKHAYAIYAFCRTADSFVDEAEEGHAKEDIQARLSELRRFGQAPYTFVPDYPWVRAFQETLSALAIPVHLFVELLNGVEMDLYKSRYATFAELYLYCYRVAGVVGQMMCYVYGLTDEASLSYAEKLGVAMQLTNILRDVGEDWGRGRLYIPEDALRKFGVSEAEIGAKQATPAYEALIRDQIAQARTYYQEAAPGIACIPSMPIRLTTLVMARLYEGILDKLEKHPAQNLTQRTALSRLEKYHLTGQTFLGLTPVGSNPLPAFYRLAVTFLLLLTPFAVVDTLTGAFAGMAGLSDSLYLLLWGVEGVSPFGHHNILFSGDYAGEFAAIAAGRLDYEPTVYVCISARTDSADAPAGSENWFVLLNVPPVGSAWREEDTMRFRERAIRRIRQVWGAFEPERIRAEAVITPAEWASMHYSTGGSLYGMAPEGILAAFRRPANRDPYVKGLYYASGTVHPGGGLPLSLKSGQIAAHLAAQDLLSERIWGKKSS